MFVLQLLRLHAMQLEYLSLMTSLTRVELHHIEWPPGGATELGRLTHLPTLAAAKLTGQMAKTPGTDAALQVRLGKLIGSTGKSVGSSGSHLGQLGNTYSAAR